MCYYVWTVWSVAHLQVVLFFHWCCELAFLIGPVLHRLESWRSLLSSVRRRWRLLRGSDIPVTLTQAAADCGGGVSRVKASLHAIASEALIALAVQFPLEFELYTSSSSTNESRISFILMTKNYMPLYSKVLVYFGHLWCHFAPIYRSQV